MDNRDTRAEPGGADYSDRRTAIDNQCAQRHRAWRPHVPAETTAAFGVGAGHPLVGKSNGGNKSAIPMEILIPDIQTIRRHNRKKNEGQTSPNLISLTFFYWTLSIVVTY